MGPALGQAPIASSPRHDRVPSTYLGRGLDLPAHVPCSPRNSWPNVSLATSAHFEAIRTQAENLGSLHAPYNSIPACAL